MEVKSFCLKMSFFFFTLSGRVWGNYTGSFVYTRLDFRAG